jgi:hypothetical protein
MATPMIQHLSGTDRAEAAVQLYAAADRIDVNGCHRGDLYDRAVAEQRGIEPASAPLCALAALAWARTGDPTDIDGADRWSTVLLLAHHVSGGEAGDAPAEWLMSWHDWQTGDVEEVSGTFRSVAQISQERDRARNET